MLIIKHYAKIPQLAYHLPFQQLLDMIDLKKA